MAEVKQWLSVKIQRALGLDSPAEAEGIVTAVLSKKDPKDIENTLIVRTFPSSLFYAYFMHVHPLTTPLKTAA